MQVEVDALLKGTTAFVKAVKDGKLDEAQKLYGPVRTHYEDIEPVAELFSDLDAAIDARADDFEKKEADPAWTGFHRIEKSLFADKTTDGLKDLAEKLLVDVTELKSRIQVYIPPDKMVGGAADLVEEVSKTKITGEEDRYSGTDIYDFQANIDGSKKIVELVKPELVKKDKPLVDSVETNFAKVDAIRNSIAWVTVTSPIQHSPMMTAMR